MISEEALVPRAVKDEASVLAGGARAVPGEHVLVALLGSRSTVARWLRCALLLLLLGLGGASLARASQSLSPDYVYMKDFVQDYLWVRAVVDGTDPYEDLTDLALRYFGFVPVGVVPYRSAHPPTAGLLMLPLAWVDYGVAATLWFAAELGAVFLAVYLLCRGSGVHSATPLALALGLAIFGWYPFHNELALGQLSTTVLVLLCGAWVALRGNRKGLAGALLGLAILIKPVPWPLLLVLLVRREWRALGGAVGAMVGGGLLTVAAVGLDRILTYQSGLRVYGELHRAEAQNMSLWTVGWRVFHGTQSTILNGISAPPLADFEAGARLLSPALPALLLLGACLAARRQMRLDLALGMMLCASLLINPISWDHYLVLAALPIALLVGCAARRELSRGAVSLALVAALPLFIPVRAWMELAQQIGGAGAGGLDVGFWPALLTYVPGLGVAGMGSLLMPWAALHEKA